MSIHAIRDAKVLRDYCKTLGREGMYKEIVELARQITEDELIPQDVMKRAGEIRAIAMGAKCDGYWDEKVSIGFHRRLEKARHAVIKTT